MTCKSIEYNKDAIANINSAIDKYEDAKTVIIGNKNGNGNINPLTDDIINKIDGDISSLLFLRHRLNELNNKISSEMERLEKEEENDDSE